MSLTPAIISVSKNNTLILDLNKDVLIRIFKGFSTPYGNYYITIYPALRNKIKDNSLYKLLPLYREFEECLQDVKNFLYDHGFIIMPDTRAHKLKTLI